MTQNSWPFHNGTSGTPVLEDQWSIMARQWAANGVIGGVPNDTTLQVYANASGRTVFVRSGRAGVRGHYYTSTAEEPLSITANSSGNPRIDRVILKLDPAANSVVLAIKQGTPAGVPSAPTLTQTDTGVYEVSLAQVLVPNGATSIAAGNVTDERVFSIPPTTLASSNRRPISPAQFQTIVESDTGAWKMWNGSTWVDSADLTARAAAAAAQASANAAQTTANAALPKSGAQAMTGNLNMGGFGLANVTAISTKSGVDNLFLIPQNGQVVICGSDGTAFAGTIGHADATYGNQSATLNQVNGRLSRYGDTVQSGEFIIAGPAGLVCEGYLRVSDAGRPEDSNVYADSDRRWLLYRGDGIVRRMADSTFRFMVLGVSGASSAALKKDIYDSSDVPDLSSLRLRQYRWNTTDSMKPKAYPGVRFGLIAEEVAEVDPRLAMLDDRGKVSGLDQNALIASLVATVNNLMQRLTALEGAD